MGCGQTSFGALATVQVNTGDRPNSNDEKRR